MQRVTLVDMNDVALDGSNPNAAIPTNPGQLRKDLDSVSEYDSSDSVMINGIACTPIFLPISASSNGDNTLLAAQTGKKIRVLEYVLTANVAVNAKFKSAANDKTGLLYAGDKGGAVAPYSKIGWFETNAAEALILNLSAGTAVGGHLAYILV